MDQKMNILLLALIFVSFCQISNGLKTTIKLHERYTLSWNLKEDDQNIMEFEAIVQTKGFIGIGFSWNGDMTGADIVVGGVLDNGEPYLHDYHGIGKQMPVLDTVQDYDLIDASENATHTTIRFSRLLLTCDNDDLKIGEDTVKIIWSFGDNDNLDYHGPDNRGAKAMFLLDPDINPPNLDGLMTYEFETHKVMPSRSTTYWCSMHKTPKLEGKHHMIAVEPILDDPDALKHIHHMNILRCLVLPGMEQMFEQWVGQEGTDCHNPNATFPDSMCLFLEYGWAIGGGITTNPDDVGFPFNSEEYFKLEAHYDNPEQREGVQFKTGLRIHYTDQLRPIDGSQFMIISPTNYHKMIPPYQSEFVNVAHCPGVCTEWFPEEGINIYSVFLHAHISARRMRVRHFRKGVELPWIVNDFTYDFNYQQNRRLRTEVKLLPGDQVTLECTYDTNWKNGSTVIGGSTTFDEMCMGFLDGLSINHYTIAFLAYYPRIETFIGCSSMTTDRNLLGFLGIERVEIGPNNPTVLAPESLAGKRFTDVVEEFDWTDEARAEYQRIHRYEPHAGVCLPLAPVYATSYPYGVPDYEPEDMCERQDGSTQNPGNTDQTSSTQSPGNTDQTTKNGQISIQGSLQLMVLFMIPIFYQ